MVGDEHVRFCGQCEKNVYNLSSLPREEAEALLVAKEGKMCVRLYRRDDGTVLTNDCPVGVKKRRRRRAALHRPRMTPDGKVQIASNDRRGIGSARDLLELHRARRRSLISSATASRVSASSARSAPATARGLPSRCARAPSPRSARRSP